MARKTGREEVRVGEAPDPGPDDGRSSSEERERGEVREVWPLLLQYRGGDADSLGDVVEGEAEDQEGPRAASPSANAAPMARPSPRLCNPIPKAIR